MNSMVEFYQPQADFGTPISKSTELVTLSIDGRDVSVPAGTSVMRAAFEAGIKVPSDPAGSAWSKLREDGATPRRVPRR